MADSDRGGSLTGLTSEEAREFHRLFMTSFLIFTIIAIIAHLMAWQWRPWIPGPEGYALLDRVNETVSSVLPFVA